MRAGSHRSVLRGPPRRDLTMHIALIIRDLIGGGAERSVLWLARGLLERGHRVDILLFQAKVHYSGEVPRDARLFVVDDVPDRLTKERAAPVLERLVPLPAPPRPLPWVHMAGAVRWDVRCLPSRRLARWTRAVMSYLESESPDCIFPSLSRAEAASLLACRFTHRHPPIVPIVRGVVRPNRTRRWRRYLFSGAAHVVSVSRGVADSLEAAVGVAGERITTIYNPVVTPYVHTGMAERPVHPWLRGDGVPVVLAAGRLHEQKDYPTLIRAFARLAAKRPCRLIILGAGEERGRLERLVHELGLSDRISLAGWVENPFAFMAHASLFVLSSIYEGLPRVLVEALACGCPCVSTDCPSGPAEILRNGRFGPLVPVGDVAALSAAMGRVLDRPPDRRALRRRASDFSVERAALRYEALVRDLIASPADGLNEARRG